MTDVFKRMGVWHFILVLIVLVWQPAPVRLAAATEAPGLVITADRQYDYAQSLFDSRDYTAAQVEFKRFIHFFPKDSRIDRARFNTAMALFHSKQFYEAAKQFNTILLKDNMDDEITREAYFMQSRAFVEMDNTGYAIVVLQNFLKLATDPEIRDRIYLELARLHIRETRKPGKDDLDDAENYLARISLSRRETEPVASMIDAVRQAKDAPKKHPGLAGGLALVPGGGFLYCERYKDAFVSFCLNAGLIWGAYEAFDSGNPGLGGVISFVESGFFAGNVYGSITAAHKYNKGQQIKILDHHFNLAAGVDPQANAYMITFDHPF